MSLEASTLTVQVVSVGITDATKALNDLAAAGEAAEQKTSKLGSGAQASAKVQVDAAQQAVTGFNNLTSSVRNATAAQDEAAKMAAKIKEQLEKIDMMGQIQRWKDAAQAARDEASALRQAQVSANSLNRDVDAFVASLKRQADTIGMSTKELREYNAEQLRSRAAQLGVSGQTDEYINKLKNAKGAHEGLSLATAGSTRELIVMGHELMTGNINKFWGSLVVEANRINIVPTLIKPITLAAEALGVSVWAIGAAFVAAATAVGMAIYTWSSTSTELKKLRTEVVLTGGAIGATGDQLYDMANKIGGSTGMYTEAYEAFNKLASTGKFTADQINLIATAAVGIQRVGGPAIDATIAQFEKLAADPMRATAKGFTGITDAAMELNKQLNFLEPEVLAEAQHLQNIGEYAKASELLIEALAKTENKRVEDLRAKLTPFGAFMSDLAVKVKAAWHDIFHEQSDEDQLASLQKRITDISQAHGTHVQWSPEESALLTQAATLQNKIAADKKKADDEAASRAKKNADDENLTWLNNMYRKSKGQSEADEARTKAEKAFQQLKADGIKADVLGAEQMKSIYEYLEKTNNKKAPKVKSEGLAGVTDTISKIQDEYEIQKNLLDNQIKQVDAANQKKIMSDSEASDAKAKLLDKEEKLAEDAMNKEMTIRKAFHSEDKRLMDQNDKAMNDLQKRLTIAQQNAASKGVINAMDDFDPKAQAAADVASQKIVEETAKQTEAIRAKVDAYNSLPEAVRNSITSEKQMVDAVTQAQIDAKQARIDFLSTGFNEDGQSDKEIQRLTSEVNATKDRVKAEKDFEEVQKRIAEVAGRPAALTKIATEQVKMWKDTGNEIEKALTNAFGNAGSAAGKMFKVFTEGQANQIDLTDKVQQVKNKDGLSDQERISQIQALQDQSAQAQIGMYGSMADAASGFFDKQSNGYKIATSISKAFHLTEMAMALATIPAKLAAGAATMFAQSGWGGFAGVAAMTAAVAAFGVAVTGGGGGGPMSSANQQKIQGTGTVLGSPTITDGVDVKLVGAKSDSIANSLKIAEKNSGLGLVVQNNMLTALQKLDSSISSFANLVVSNYNLSNPNVNLNTNNGGATKGVQVSTFAAMGSYFGLIGTAIGAIVGLLAKNVPVIGKIATSIFGGKQTVDDSGISVGKTSLNDISANGLNAQAYTNVTTSGGWFRSDKHNVQTQSLGAEFNDQITKVVLSMEDALKTAAVGLGMGGDDFNKKLQSFVVDIGNISFKGMTGDEIQKTLQNVFSKLGDQMAQFAFADLQKYQKIGEGLMETVVRVANDLQQVKDVFDSLSKSIPAGMAAIEASEALISQFGSVDNLTKGVKAYISAIYTDQEKLMPIIKSVSTAMDSLGLSYVKTKEQFKAVVDSLDLTTEAGAKMFATLMNIAPAFAQTIDDSEKLANDARSALTDAYKRESQAITDTQTKMKNLVTTLQQLGSSSLLGDLSPLTPQQKYLEAKSQFETIAAKAQGGDETAQGQFEGAYTAFLEASKVANASGAQYQKDFEYAQKVTQQATEWAQKQVNVQQATLDALNKQVEGLIDVNDGLLTVSQAIQNLITAMKGTPAGATAQQQASTNAKNAIEGLYQSILHRASDTAGMQFWMDKVSQGVSIADIAKAIANSDEAMGNIKPISADTSTTAAVAPVTAMVGTQSVAHADVVTAVKEMQTAVTNAIAETGQTTTSQLATAVYDSQDKAADKTVAGVSDAVVSAKVGTSYQIKQR